MTNEKLRVRQVPASTLRAGDMFIDSAGIMAKVIFRCNSVFGSVRYSCIDADGSPALVSFDRDQMVVKITDRRAYAPQGA